MVIAVHMTVNDANLLERFSWTKCKLPLWGWKRLLWNQSDQEVSTLDAALIAWDVSVKPTCLC
eukprot:6196007-Amphidinium_carterae.1